MRKISPYKTGACTADKSAKVKFASRIIVPRYPGKFNISVMRRFIPGDVVSLTNRIPAPERQYLFPLFVTDFKSSPIINIKTILQLTNITFFTRCLTKIALSGTINLCITNVFEIQPTVYNKLVGARKRLTQYKSAN